MGKCNSRERAVSCDVYDPLQILGHDPDFPFVNDDQHLQDA